MDTNNRIKWVDIAKGIGIILVIVGHTIALEYSAPIYTFHMPLFFFLSGLFLNTDVKLKAFIKKKAKSILGVWLLVFLLSYIVCICIPEWRQLISFKSLVVDLYSANTNVVQNSSLWYLICLFFAEVIFYFVEKIKAVINQKVFYAIFGLFTMIVLILPNVLNMISNYIPLTGGRLPFKIDTALCAVVFLSLGKWIKPYISKLMDKMTILLTISILIVWILLAYINGWTNMNSLNFGVHKLLFYPIAIMGIGWVCGLSNYIAEKPNNIVSKALVFYGENCLMIFLFQSLFIRLYLLVANRLLGLEMTLYMNNPMEHQIGSFVVVGFIISPIMVLLYKRVKVALSW